MNLIGQEIFVGRMFHNNEPMIGIITIQTDDKVFGYMVNNKSNTFGLYIKEAKRMNKKLIRQSTLNELGI